MELGGSHEARAGRGLWIRRSQHRNAGGWGGAEVDHRPWTGVDTQPVSHLEWGQGHRQAATTLILREMCHLADISLFLIFVMKKATCNHSKENKISTTTAAVIAITSPPEPTPEIVGPE